MTARHASRLIACASLLALVAGFLAPFPALAEEALPPAEPTAEATLLPEPVAPTAEPTLEPAPPDEALPVPSEAAPAEGDVPPTTEPAPVEEPAAEPDLAGLIEAVPEGTTVAVVGEDGTLLPLASEAAAEVIPSADPIWCPASVKAPTPDANGCTVPYASFAQLIADLPLLPLPGDGIIWFDDSYDSSVHDPAVLNVFNLDGSGSLSVLAPFKLTLRGGWDPVTNKVLPGAHSDFHVRLQIQNWGNDVTLSDILISGAPVGDDLVVLTSGNITLTRVQSSDNLGRGARLDNTSATSAKSVTISDSQFNGNDATGGLSVLSEGAITLTNVTAGYYDEDTNTSHGNTGYGATLYNAYPGVTAGVTLKGVSTFSNNSGTGLQITSNGPITASDLTASGNTVGRGAWLINIAPPSAPGVTLTGTNIFAGNATTGLEIDTLGPIKLNNLNAHSNAAGYGADLDNSAASTPQSITLTGTNSFKYNFNTGLRILSVGAVLLNNVTASGNTNGRGATINNTATPTASPVTLTGSNTFNDNYFDGLTVSTLGAIKAANLTANGNALVSHSGCGLFLNNSSAYVPLPVTLTGWTTASSNYNQGLSLHSIGPVAIQNLTVNGSAHHLGAEILNNYDPAGPPQKVTLSGTNTFLGNYGYGLSIDSYGAVTLSSVTASGNGSGTSAPGLAISNTGAATPQKVTLTGTNVFRDNDGAGLTVNSGGAIAASSLTASDNGSSGAILDNASAPSPQAVTLTVKNVFSGNNGDGLYVYSIGAVSLASLTADDNVGYGVDVNNTVGPASSPQKVSLSGSHQFRDNAYSGLSVGGLGAITISSATATGNGILTGDGNGIGLSNSGSAAPQPVTLSGSFILDGNADAGLYVAASGLIKTTNLTVRNNLGPGATMANAYPGRTAGVTLSGKNLIEGNTYGGLTIESYGPITVADLTASGNGILGFSGGGAYLYNALAATPQKVTLTGTNLFNDNYSTGLEVVSLGAIAASSLSASRNSVGANGYGAFLDNGAANAVGGVSLSGISAFIGNAFTGLDISSRGAIALNTTRLEASGNGVGSSWGGGATLVNNNSALTTPPGVTLKGLSTFHENRSTGLFVLTLGAITASNLSASGNGTGGNGYGAQLDNDDNPLSTGGITLSGSNVFDGNANSGLDASSRGAITISNLTASANGAGGAWGNGARLANDPPGGAVRPIKLTGYGTFTGNLSQGLVVDSLGAISAANLTASGNQSDGAALFNDDPDAVGAITLTGTNAFNGNDRIGLNIASLGAVTISNLTASGNGTGGSGDGAWIYNASAATPQAVKITGYGTFNDNASSGLSLESKGAVSAANLTARGNAASNGVYLNNSIGTAGITLSGANIFTGNGENGLFISSLGAVSATKITADDNTLSGMYVSNAASLTVTCGSFVHNGVFGLYVNTISPTAPILIGVFASGNNPGSGNLIWAGHGAITSTVRACPLN